MSKSTASHSSWLKEEVEPFEPKAGRSVSEILKSMFHLSFQGRQLGRCYKVWDEMARKADILFFGLAGAMVPAGMRKIVVWLIEHKLIDCLVATGANLFHDLHETLGYKHYMGNPNVSDSALKIDMVDRIYDTYADERQFREVEKFIIEASKWMAPFPYTTREFFKIIGQRLVDSPQNGIIRAAFLHKVPVYCPALGDSSYGIALSDEHLYKTFKQFDIIRDVSEMARLVMDNKTTGVVYVGGGTPKNFIQQASVTILKKDGECEGHKYAVQFTSDAPHWGGLSGCTFEEAQSWGKISEGAHMASCCVDATIALPLVVSALASKSYKRKRPHYPFSF